MKTNIFKISAAALLIIFSVQNIWAWDDVTECPPLEKSAPPRLGAKKMNPVESVEKFIKDCERLVVPTSSSMIGKISSNAEGKDCWNNTASKKAFLEENKEIIYQDKTIVDTHLSKICDGGKGLEPYNYNARKVEDAFKKLEEKVRTYADNIEVCD